ncbi:carboxypeptidase regulatory-like domain-containing protein, partial [uncultured Robinsoniella sp.]|uniref:carboxypeptidase regulatory-like domain-containing protein n=1 Tax=uncultured Robinsoniella sp. TaxID=904190 RepID=UPI00374F076C
VEAGAVPPPATSVNSGPEKANDGDTDTSKNGFAILENQDDANKYLQYDWLEGKDITSLKLSTSYAQRRGAQECKILVSSDGTNFEELALWSDIVWETDENVIETKVYNLSEEEKKKASNVKAMRFQIVKAKYAWDSTIIMELEVMGKTSVQQTDSHKVEYSQPLSGGSILASSEGADVESGSHIEEGKSVTLEFSPLRGYSLKAAYVNDVEVSVSADGTYQIDSLGNDISVRAEFIENTISGKVDMSAAGDSPEGIKVTLYGTFGEKEAQTTADREGSYTFSRIPFGEYTVGIDETDRYTAEKVAVTLNQAAATAEPITPVLKSADKTALLGLIGEMKKVNLSPYTQESADGFRKVLAEAEILAGKNLTVDQAGDITNMIAKLNQAKSSLSGLTANRLVYPATAVMEAASG